MHAYTDPDNDEQVMAVYTHESDSEVWIEKGYDRHEVADSVSERITRDCVVTGFDDDGAITSIEARENPLKPTLDLGVDIDRKEAFLAAGESALDHRDAMDANANIPPEVVAFADDQLRMLYLIYVHLAGESNRIDSFEERFFSG